MELLDKVEEVLIKIFLVLFVAIVICQMIIRHPLGAELLVFLQRLEGTVYTYGGLN